MNKYIFPLTQLIKLYLKLFVLIIAFWSCSEKKEGISLTFTGDVFLDRGVKDEILLHGDTILVNSLNKFSEQDFLIINCEGTFTNSKKSKLKGYSFKADGRFASLLYQGGVTHASIANNHSFDYGEEGFQNTIDALEHNNIIPLGEKCDPVFIKSGSYKCAILSVSLTVQNKSFCISSLEILKKKVQVFNKHNPNIPLILFVHWGLEYQTQPERWQKNLAKELVEFGVDAIIGHHPHVLQSMEYIDDVPVFYSIGNFIADAYLPLSYESIVVNLNIINDIVDISIIPVNLRTYFPIKLNKKLQMNIIKNFLQNSNKIGIINNAGQWKLKKTESIDFTEDADFWLFAENEFVVAIKQLKSGTKVLSLLKDDGYSNSISLHGDLSEITIADIDNDNEDDVLLGIRKSVKFDPLDKKRINIYSYQNGNLQPLWLGTKFIYDLISFDVYRSKGLNYLRTIESDSLGNIYTGIYEWDNFGFALNTIKPIGKKESYEKN